MTKQEFLEKHGMTEMDYRNLIRYERSYRIWKNGGSINMFNYVWQMKKYNINGGKRLSDWIVKAGNYEEFLSTLGKEEIK